MLLKLCDIVNELIHIPKGRDNIHDRQCKESKTTF